MQYLAVQIVDEEEEDRRRKQFEQEKRAEEKQRVLLERLNELKKRQEAADLRVSYLVVALLLRVYLYILWFHLFS